jgi:hypothetical protein
VDEEAEQALRARLQADDPDGKTSNLDRLILMIDE